MKDLLKSLLEIFVVATITVAIGIVVITIIDTHEKVDVIYKNLLEASDNLKQSEPIINSKDLRES